MLMCSPIIYIDSDTNKIFESGDEVKIEFWEYAIDKYDGLLLIGTMQYLCECHFTLFNDYSHTAYTVNIDDIYKIEKIKKG